MTLIDRTQICEHRMTSIKVERDHKNNPTFSQKVCQSCGSVLYQRRFIRDATGGYVIESQ
jgi:hypothetical protein